MKRELALLMTAVMSLTTPGSTALASDVADVIIVADETSETELTDDEETEVETENVTEKSQTEEGFIVSIE